MLKTPIPSQQDTQNCIETYKNIFSQVQNLQMNPYFFLDLGNNVELH